MRLDKKRIKNILTPLVSILKEKWGDDLISVVAFGSYVKGTEREESDIDVLVVKKIFSKSRLKRREEFLNIKSQLPENLKNKLMAILYTPEEVKVKKFFYLGILNNHFILYDRDDFFSGIMDEFREKLKEIGARKVMDKNCDEYWILKENYKLGDVVEL